MPSKDFYQAGRAKAKAYYHANKERLAARRKAYRRANRERIAAMARARYQANKEKMTAKAKAYRRANRERIAAWHKAYYQANKEKLAAHGKAYRQANKAKEYKFRSNSDLYLTGDLRQMLPGVTAYGVQFDLNLYAKDKATQEQKNKFVAAGVTVCYSQLR